MDNNNFPRNISGLLPKIFHNDNSQEPGKTLSLTEEIALNLGCILNSRRALNNTNDGELAKSILSYGLNESYFYILRTEKQKQQVIREVANMITTYEPRLIVTTVKFIEVSQHSGKGLNILVEGRVRQDKSNCQFMCILKCARPWHIQLLA